MCRSGRWWRLSPGVLVSAGVAGPRFRPAGGGGCGSVPTVTPPKFRQRDWGGSAGAASSSRGAPSWRDGVATPEEGRGDVDLSNVELIVRGARNLARFRCPTDIELVDVLPRSKIGTVRKTPFRPRPEAPDRVPPEPGTYQPAPSGTTEETDA